MCINININQSTFSHAEDIQAEGLVLLGTGGDPYEWLYGVHDLWINEGVTAGSKEQDISECFTLTTENRTDLVMVFSEENRINFGRLAIWRLRFGDCSWLSDYRVLHRDQGEEE